MSLPTSIHTKAINLRKQGYSYSYISEKTGVRKSTLSGWLSGISYKPNQETIEKIGKARTASNQAKSQIKINSIQKARREAKREIGKLSTREIFMLGIGLYIGEGTKTHDIVRLANADPKIIRFMIKWFEVVCGLSRKNFKIRLHLYPDSNEKECVEYWSRFLAISHTQFQKTQIDKRKNKKTFKKHKLPYGTAHLSVLSNGKKEFGVFLARKISAWREEVLKL